MKKTILALAVFFMGMSCEESHSVNTTATNTVNSSKTSLVNKTAKTEQEVKELIEEGSKDLTALIKEARTEKNRRDSVFAASRQEVWVYQIGESKSNPEAFENIYYKLTKNIQHVYFFKQSTSKYYLILHDGYNTEQELIDKQAAVESSLTKAGIKDKVSILNITTYCSLKEHIKPADEIKLVKKEWAVCYACDE